MIQSPNKPSFPPPSSRLSPKGELSPPALFSQVLNLFAFATACRAKNYLQDSVCSLAHFRADARPLRHPEPDNSARAGIVENFAICMSNSLSEIWFGQIYTFFIPQGAVEERKRQATTDPDSETTSSSDSDSSSSLGTLSSEDEDEKDFLLSDYPSEELMSSEVSDFEPEDASAENLSTGWSERVTRVDTQFFQDDLGPQKTSQTTLTTRAPHFPSLRCSSMQISGGYCAAKKLCELSRSAILARFMLCQEF